MKENLSLARDRFVLIDTNILIDSVKDIDSFSSMYQEMAKINAKPILDELIHFEFVRNSPSNAERAVTESFLKDILSDPVMLIPDKKVIEDAVQLTMIYSRHKSPSVDLADCMIAAQMKKYGDRLVLLTQNHKDYPPCVFDLLGAFALPGKDRIHTVGIYSFNQERFEQHLARL